jgi:hypothetical protein
VVAYVYAPDRKAERPEAHLADFAGILQVDGYSGYTALIRRRQQVSLAFCWGHVRRKFFDLARTLQWRVWRRGRKYERFVPRRGESPDSLNNAYRLSSGLYRIAF